MVEKYCPPPEPAVEAEEMPAQEDKGEATGETIKEAADDNIGVGGETWSLFVSLTLFITAVMSDTPLQVTTFGKSSK